MIGDKARHTLKKCSGCSTFGKWYDTFPGKSTKKAATCHKVHKVVKDLKHTPPSSSPENVLSVFRNAYKDLTDRDLDEDIVKTPGSNLEKKKTAAEKKRYLREVTRKVKRNLEEEWKKEAMQCLHSRKSKLEHVEATARAI